MHLLYSLVCKKLKLILLDYRFFEFLRTILIESIFEHKRHSWGLGKIDYCVNLRKGKLIF